MQQQLIQQDTYRSSRAEALHNVESTIVELGTIFNQLADLVSVWREGVRFGYRDFWLGAAGHRACRYYA
jgi:hypothetical protein